MISIFDELAEKVRQDPRLTKRGGARVDLSLLLFNSRDAIRELWIAADLELGRAREDGHEPSPELQAAVEELRPVFGTRAEG